jgi:hypothetical protein
MKKVLLENLSNIPDHIIDSTILAIIAHKEMYDINVPYRWTVDKGWNKSPDWGFPISNMKHWKTPNELQDWPDLYFENLMLPYIYPKIKEWIEVNKPQYKDVKFHTQSCWYLIYKNENKENTSVPVHNHKGQGRRTTGLNQEECCSGVFYLNAPNSPTRTFEYYCDDGKKTTIHPKTKDVVLFSTNMNHAADESGPSPESIVIAFNVLFYKEKQ